MGARPRAAEPECKAIRHGRTVGEIDKERVKVSPRPTLARAACVRVQAAMRRFFDPRQLAHAPTMELHNGGFVPFAETPARAEAVLAAIGGAKRAIDHGEAPLPRGPCRGLSRLPLVGAQGLARGRARRRRGRLCLAGRAPPAARSSTGSTRRLGQYSFDASSPIAAGTWEGAYWSAQTALTALDAVLAGERSAFALCRPPGHHCGARLSRRLLLPQQRRDRRAGGDRRGPAQGRDPRRRLSPRQRHAGHLLRAR